MANQAERLKKWKKRFAQKGGKQINIYLQPEAARHLKELQVSYPDQTQTRIISRALALLNDRREKLGEESQESAAYGENMIETKLRSLLSTDPEIAELIEEKIETFLYTRIQEKEIVTKQMVEGLIEDKIETMLHRSEHSESGVDVSRSGLSDEEKGRKRYEIIKQGKEEGLTNKEINERLRSVHPDLALKYPRKHIAALYRKMQAKYQSE